MDSIREGSIVNNPQKTARSVDAFIARLLLYTPVRKYAEHHGCRCDVSLAYFCSSDGSNLKNLKVRYTLFPLRSIRIESHVLDRILSTSNFDI